MKEQKGIKKSKIKLILLVSIQFIMLVFAIAILSKPAFCETPLKDCPKKDKLHYFCNEYVPNKLNKWGNKLDRWQKVANNKEIILARCKPESADRLLREGWRLSNRERVRFYFRYVDPKTKDVFLILNRLDFKQMLIEDTNKTKQHKRKLYKRAQKHTKRHVPQALNRSQDRVEYWRGMYSKCCTGGWEEPPTTTREPILDPREHGLLGEK